MAGETAEHFAQPQEISKVVQAFPADLDGIIPPTEIIPETFSLYSRNPWVKVASQRFAHGWTGVNFVTREGIDPNRAIEHVDTICGSFQPKHEHKISAMAWLLSLWFENIVIDGKIVTE